MLRKAEVRLDPATARIWLDTVLGPLCKVNPDTALYQGSLDVQTRYGFSFYDSLIVAAALDAGCKRLLNEDLQHGQGIEGLVGAGHELKTGGLNVAVQLDDRAVQLAIPPQAEGVAVAVEKVRRPVRRCHCALSCASFHRSMM